jgi:hypothetical protein
MDDQAIWPIAGFCEILIRISMSGFNALAASFRAATARPCMGW